MPTYVYACDRCGQQFEHFQSFKEAPLQVCSLCGQDNSVRRVFQPVGIVFKGSGWYITDSRGNNSSSVGSSANGKDDKGDKSSSADKTDTASTDTTSSAASTSTTATDD